MKISRQIYLCGVAGAAAGVLAWLLIGQVNVAEWKSLTGSAALVGVGIGAPLVAALTATRGYYEQWSISRLGQNLAIAFVAGSLVGAAGLVIAQWLFTAINTDWTGRIVGWVVLNLFLGVGQVFLDFSPRKLVIGAIAGLVSGLACGLAYEGLTQQFRANGGDSLIWASALGMLVVGGAFGVAIPLAERIAARAVVVIRSGERSGSEYPLLDRLDIGSGESSKVIIPDDSEVSARHLELQMAKGQIQVRNVGSAAATVNANEVPAGGETVCTKPAKIRVGSTEISIV